MSALNDLWDKEVTDLSKEIKKLKEDNEQLKFENQCLKEDIKNMYDEEVIINILEDKFDLTREEALEVLGEE